MELPLILMAFVFLAIVIALAWWGKRRTSFILFCIFLFFAVLVFWHHMTDSLPIQL